MTPSITDRLEHLRWMVLARVLDDRLAALYRQGQLAGSAFLGRGQEAYSAAAGMRIRQATPERDGDIYAPLIRDTAGRLAAGETLLDVFRVCLGRRTGSMRGRDGNIHRGLIERGQLAMISHLGAMVSAVVGVLMAKRLRGRLGGGDQPIGVVCLGDGAMAAGATHEGLNAAGIERLPLVACVANNQVSYSTFNDRSFACRHLIDRAAAYGFTGHTCDGTDADACLRTVGAAIAAARRGEGPQMVVADLLRLAGHGEHDDASYVTAELKSRFGDCLPLTERTLKTQGVIDDAGLARLWADAKTAVQTAYDTAQAEPEPDPAREDWCAFADRELLGIAHEAPALSGDR